jgi:hypothetical protein
VLVASVADRVMARVQAAAVEPPAAVRGPRDGDRFFYLHDPALGEIESRYGITYRNTLGAIIEMNTGIDVRDNVFELAPG